MVRNSVGISTCNGHGWKVDYVVRKVDKGQPLNFFQAPHKGTWHWALDGFLYKDDLWMTLLCMRNAPKSTPTALGFETCGADLARVSGLENDPQRWSVKYFPLVPDGVHAYPSATRRFQGDAFNVVQHSSLAWVSRFRSAGDTFSTEGCEHREAGMIDAPQSPKSAQPTIGEVSSGEALATRQCGWLHGCCESRNL
jgi:hypothetical protein